MPAGKKLTSRFWLFPHERWLARYAGRVQNAPPGGRRWQFQQMYGPAGDVVAAAYLADFLAAFILCITGAILVNVPNKDPLVAPGACLLAIGGFLGLMGMIRVLQLAQVGRDFRADRVTDMAETQIAGPRSHRIGADAVHSKLWPAGAATDGGELTEAETSERNQPPGHDLKLRTPDTICAYCGEPISASQPARLAGAGFWVHESCHKPRQ